MTGRRWPPVALVTGGSRRIGGAICEGLAGAGYRVAVHCHDSAEDAEERAAALGGGAFAIECDLRDASSARALVPRIAAEAGPVSLLVNNASIFEADGPGDAADELWDAHFDVHLRAPALLSQALVDGLPEGTKGHILNVIDQRVLAPGPDFTSYTLSKSALWTMTRTLARRYAPHVRVNAIGPGPTLPSRRQDEASFAAQVKAVPLECGPTLDEMVRTVLFLDGAASVTGQMIALDGGQHLDWRTPSTVLPE